MKSPWTYWIVDVERMKNLAKGNIIQVVFPTLDQAEKYHNRVRSPYPIRKYFHDTQRLSQGHRPTGTQNAKEA